jgi:hypothetical protein
MSTLCAILFVTIWYKDNKLIIYLSSDRNVDQKHSASLYMYIWNG